MSETVETAPVETSQASWLDSLPEPLRADQNITKFKGVEDLATAYLNAVKLIGAQPDKVVRLDQVPAAEVLKRLGVPDQPEKYELKAPEGVPAELAEGEALAWYRQVAKEANLLPEQAQAVYEAYVKRVAEIEAAANEQVKQTETALRMKWGPAYDQNLRWAKSAVQALGLSEVVAANGLGGNQAFIEAMTRVGQAMFKSESGPLATGNAPLPPEDARAEGKRMLEQAYAAFRNGRAAEAKKLQQEAYRYFQMATGT